MYNQTSIVACQKCGHRLTGSANSIVRRPNTDVVHNISTHSFEEFDNTINELLREDTQHNTINQLQTNTDNSNRDLPPQPKVATTSTISHNQSTKVNQSKPTKRLNNIRQQSPSQVQSTPNQQQSQAVYQSLAQHQVVSQPLKGEVPHLQQPVQQVVYTSVPHNQPQYVNYAQQPVYSNQYVSSQHVVPQYTDIVKPSNYNLARYGSGSGKSVSLIAFFAGVVGWLALFVALIFELDIRQSGFVSFVLGVAGIVCVFLAYGMRQNKIWTTVALVIIIQLIIYTSVVMLV
jgi:hypothetical protein